MTSSRWLNELHRRTSAPSDVISQRDPPITAPLIPTTCYQWRVNVHLTNFMINAQESLNIQNVLLFISVVFIVTLLQSSSTGAAREMPVLAHASPLEYTSSVAQIHAALVGETWGHWPGWMTHRMIFKDESADSLTLTLTLTLTLGRFLTVSARWWVERPDKTTASRNK